MDEKPTYFESRRKDLVFTRYFNGWLLIIGSVPMAGLAIFDDIPIEGRLVCAAMAVGFFLAGRWCINWAKRNSVWTKNEERRFE